MGDMKANQPTVAKAPQPLSQQQFASQDLWQEAIKSIQIDQQEQLLLITADKLTVLNDALAAAQDKKEQCFARQWKYVRRDGTTIVLRDVFDRIVSWIEKFKDIGDFVVSLIPTYAEIPWAAVSLFLQMAITDTHRFASVFEGIELVTNLITRYAIFEEIYLQHSSKTVALLKQAIVTLYAKVLTYLAEAKRYYSQNTAKRMAKSVFQLSENGLFDLTEEITSQQTTVDELARLVDAEGARAGFHEANKNLQHLRTILTGLEQPLQRLDDQLAELAKDLNKSRRREILGWISRMPYTQHQDNVRKDRLDSSGLWLLGHTEYIWWRQARSSCLLWIHGIPGCGKSKLVSLVVDTLRENALNRQHGALAYVFCLRNTAEPERSDPDAIVRCILRQLSCPTSSAPISPPIVQKYQELQEEGFDPRGLTIDESKQLLLELLEVEPATIIIDALDECNPDRRYQLFNVLEELLHKAKKPVKVLVSSREHGDITARLNGRPNLIIESSKSRRDIDTFIDMEVERAVHEKRLLDGDISAELQQTLTESLRRGADGMFLWVSLQIQNLCRHKLESDIEAQLDKLPSELADVYSEIYDQVLKAGANAQKLAVTALRWLICAEKPLATDDFINAVSFDAIGRAAPMKASALLDICGNLIKIDTELDIFRFSHSSVREFLEDRADFAPSLTHATAAEICFNTLLADDWLFSDVTRQKAALYEYVTLYWASHTEKSGRDFHTSKAGVAFLELFSKDNHVTPWFAKWLLQVESASQTLGWDDPLKDKIEQSLSAQPETVFFTACTFGFLDVVEFIADKDRSVTKRANAKGATGLHLASQYGHLEVVKVLLQRAVVIDAKDEDAETSLVRASAAGHTSIVRELVNHGADCYIRGAKYGSALQAASLRGHHQVVQLLLNEADIEAESGQFGTALQAAALRGHTHVVKMLLDKGADIDAPGGDYTASQKITGDKATSTAVLTAVEYLLEKQREMDGPMFRRHSPQGRFEAIVQLLLDKKLDLNVQQGGFGPALHAASRGGHAKTVEALLRRNADIHAEGGAYGTALQAGAVGGEQEVIQLLLEGGADVNALSGTYNTALQAACRFKHANIVQKLLDKGADVNAEGGVYGTALQAAARAGVKDVIKLLLGENADVNAVAGTYSTALQAASEQGFDEIVEMLLNSGADPNIEGGKFGSALQAATANGHTNIVQQLQQKNAALGNSLQIACLAGHEVIVKYLLENGANPNAEGRCFGTALQMATASAQNDVVRMLLEREANVNESGSDFGTALELAVVNGDKRLVRLLLDNGADPGKTGKSDCCGPAAAALLRGEDRPDESFIFDSFIRNSNQRPSFILGLAARAGYLDIMQMLLEEIKTRKDPRTRTSPHVDALTAASRSGQKASVELLLDKAEEFGYQGSFSTSTLSLALQDAVVGNHTDIACLLLKKGALANDEDSQGTPLHVASHFGYQELVKILLLEGADPRAIGKARCSPLFLACSGGHIETVRLLLARAAVVDDPEAKYTSCYREQSLLGTSLQAAAYHGFSDILELLLENNADVRRSAGTYDTALQAACAGDHENIVRRLLGRQADVHSRGGMYDTPLQAAAYNGSESIVRLLISHGADINIEGGGRYGSALQAAAFGNHEDVVKLLIDEGANARNQGGAPQKMPGQFAISTDRSNLDDAPPKNANSSRRHQSGKFGTALQAAAEVGNAKIVRILLDNGADIGDTDEHGQTPIHRAAHKGHEEAVRVLLDHGADVNQVDGSGRTALRWVANHGFYQLLGLLWNKGAEINLRDRQGHSALHRAAINGHIAIAKNLLDNGAQLEGKDLLGRTPLMSAAEHGQPEMIRYLLSRGADPNDCDAQQNMAMHIAAAKGFHTVLRLLIEAGASVDCGIGQGQTPLHEAARHSYYRVPYILILRGATIDARLRSGETPLHLATTSKDCVVLKLLLAKGANWRATSGGGRTALHYAAISKNPAAIKILLDKGLDVNVEDNDGRTPLDMTGNDSQYWQSRETLVANGGIKRGFRSRSLSRW